MPFINARSIHTYTASDYAAHLREIRNHWSRLQLARKMAVKERQAETKVVAKPYTFRYNTNGRPILTIRGRSPTFLYAYEWRDLESTYPDSREDLQRVIAKRRITIKPDPRKSS